jgi:hypothetical protein
LSTLPPPGPFAGLLSALSTIGAIALLLITCFLRTKIRERDNIPGACSENACCSTFEDLCCAAFCMCCVQSQMMRHEGLTGSRRYELLSSDGQGGVIQV